MTARRVVLTGIGVLSSIGNGVTEFTRGLREGRCGAGPITRFDSTGFRRQLAHEVHDFTPSAWVRHTPAEQLGRATQFSVAAARMAVSDAGLDPADLRGGPGLVTVGTTDGEADALDRLVEAQANGTEPAGLTRSASGGSPPTGWPSPSSGNCGCRARCPPCSAPPARPATTPSATATTPCAPARPSGRSSAGRTP